jgi:hypothetical protein
MRSKGSEAQISFSHRDNRHVIRGNIEGILQTSEYSSKLALAVLMVNDKTHLAGRTHGEISHGAFHPYPAV